MRYRVTHRSAAAQPGLTQVLAAMNRILLLLIALFIASCANTGISVVQDNSSLNRRILGTWQSVDEQTGEVQSESTYTSDGQVRGFTTRGTRYSDGTVKTEQIKMHANWRISDGILVLDQVNSEQLGLFPPNRSLQYRIESLTPTDVIFIDLSNGDSLHRRRQPGG